MYWIFFHTKQMAHAIAVGAAKFWHVPLCNGTHRISQSTFDAHVYIGIWPAQRLEILFNDLSDILEEYKPDKFGVEELFFNRNVTTAIKVGQARGVILLAAEQQRIPIYEYTPLQIKQAVTGYGKADKNQVIYMTMNILGIREKIKPDDTADALAVAICTAHSSHQDRLMRLIK